MELKLAVVLKFFNCIIFEVIWKNFIVFISLCKTHCSRWILATVKEFQVGQYCWTVYYHQKFWEKLKSLLSSNFTLSTFTTFYLTFFIKMINRIWFTLHDVKTWSRVTVSLSRHISVTPIFAMLSCLFQSFQKDEILSICCR